MPRYPTKPKPASEPILTCPFTGKELVIRQNPTTKTWQAVGEFYFTAPFEFKSHLLYAISTRNGAAPSFPKGVVEVVGVREPPPENPVADLIEKEKKLDELTQEYLK